MDLPEIEEKTSFAHQLVKNLPLYLHCEFTYYMMQDISSKIKQYYNGTKLILETDINIKKLCHSIKTYREGNRNYFNADREP